MTIYDDSPGIDMPKPTEIVISGIDKQRVGQVAAEIREYRGPSPYKGKGVKYTANTSSARKARRNNWWYKWLRKSLPPTAHIRVRKALAKRAICVRGFRCSARARTFMHRSIDDKKA
jgi:hypothetical protein